MGQKVNPIIFRLGKTTSWKQRYFENKPNEIANYSFKSLEIKKFIFKFFKDNGLIVQNCKLNYKNENSLHIYVSYYLTLESISLVTQINKQQNLKLIKSKQRIKKNKYLKLKKSISNYLKYQKLVYNKYLNNNIQKKNFYNIKQVLQAEQKIAKARRMDVITSYKQNLRVKNLNRAVRIKFNTFLENFFKSLHLFLGKNINIFITLKQLNKNIKNAFDIKKTKLIKKKLVSIKKYEKNEFFKDGINILYTCSNKPNSANLLADYISTQLEKLKHHNFFLKFIKSALTIFKSQNIKIKIKGRFNGAPRAKHKLIVIGNGVPVLTLKSSVDYSEKTSYTANGTFGVKVWIQNN